MSSPFSYQTFPARFSQDVNQKAVVTNHSTSATAGVAVPDGFRGEIVHCVATKVNTATVKVWGYSNILTAGKWVQLDTLTFSEENDEAAPLRGVAAYQRVQCSINAIGTTNVNTYFGFSE